MSAESLVQVVLMAFVLLAPLAMVAVLVSGLSRREQAVAPVGAVETVGTVEAVEVLDAAA